MSEAEAAAPKQEETVQEKPAEQPPKEDEGKKQTDWAEMSDNDEDAEKEVIPAKPKKVAQPKRAKNEFGDYVVTKIEIPDQPAHKEITKIKPVSSCYGLTLSG